jgi:hypothetical protein
VEGGAERVGKWLHLLTHNTSALALASSPVAEVRAMKPTTVFEPLLRLSVWALGDSETTTMRVDALDATQELRGQKAHIEVFKRLKLTCRGTTLIPRLRERAKETT